jgi:hypothetical protein
VTHNVITLPPKDRDETIARVAEVLRFFQLGKPVNVKMTIARPERTVPQLRYLWGVPYKLLADAFGFEPEEIHEYLCGNFWGWKPKKLPGGRSHEVPIRTTTEDEDGNRDVIDGKAFWDYVEWIQRVGARQGVVIPDPDPNYKIARRAA